MGLLNSNKLSLFLGGVIFSVASFAEIDVAFDFEKT